MSEIDTKTNRQLIRGAWQKFRQFEELRLDKVRSASPSNHHSRACIVSELDSSLLTSENKSLGVKIYSGTYRTYWEVARQRLGNSLHLNSFCWRSFRLENLFKAEGSLWKTSKMFRFIWQQIYTRTFFITTSSHVLVEWNWLGKNIKDI